MTGLLPALSLPWMDPEQLIHGFGSYALWGVAMIIFAECGLFAILPGDSLLFTMGLFVAVGAVNQPLGLVCLVLTIAAILGNACGYALGRLIGPPLFRPRAGMVGRVLNPAYVTRTRHFLDHHGHRALILARFVPIVRTFVTLVAGVSRMSFARFIGFTAVGGVLWACGVLLLGFFLGNVTWIRSHIDLVLVAIVAVSLLPMLAEVVRHRLRRDGAGATEVIVETH